MVSFMVCGIYNLVFGIFHLTFWKLLDWKNELKRVSANNRAVMQTLNLCLTWMFLLVAYLFLFNADEMKTTLIGRVFGYGILLLWIARTVCQLVFFNMKKRVHQILFVIFLVGVVIHTIAIINF